MSEKRTSYQEGEDTSFITDHDNSVNTENMGIPIFGFVSKVTSSRLILLLLVNLLFVGASSVAFMRIENKSLPLHQKTRKESLSYLLEGMHSQRYHNRHRGINETYWRALADLHRPRCHQINNRHTENNLWNFWSSLDFCATLLTTIGYGNMSPRTTAGKLFTVAYSSVGIPLMAMYLALFSKGIYRLSRVFIRYCVNCLRRIHLEVASTTINILSLLVLTLLLGTYIGVLSYIMTATDSTDSWVQCFYFYTITLSTVGLGDMAMTEALPYVLIRILLVFCVGLTLVTAVFNALRHLIASKKRVVNRSKVKMQAATYFIAKANANRVRRASMRWLRRVSEKRSVRTAKDLKKSSDPREIKQLGTVFKEDADSENSRRIFDDLSQSIDLVSV